MTTIPTSAVYERLEEKMLSYRDYADIPVIPSLEEKSDDKVLVPVESCHLISIKPVNGTMDHLTGEDIYVRPSVLDLLYWAGRELKNVDPGLTLEIAYGYRAMEVQCRLFEQVKYELAPLYHDDQELLEAAHRQIAIPSVAGHPTGGAVDVRILRNGEPVDMGTELWDFSRDSFTFSPFISREAWDNRHLLRRAMMASGFAPFDGEWWHFSYGDKEWACYYGKPGAFYDQIYLDAPISDGESADSPSKERTR